jgi:hypothetical protein
LVISSTPKNDRRLNKIIGKDERRRSVSLRSFGIQKEMDLCAKKSNESYSKLKLKQSILEFVE